MTTNAPQSKFKFAPTLESRSERLSSECETFAQKERSCGRAWSALGAYLSEILDDSAYPKITHEEALSLGGAAFAGDRAAVDVLVKSHLRLVVKIAREYESFGVQISDLVAEGNLGLLRAAELYNPKFGTRFLNYAAVWIRQRIQRAIAAQTRAVRIPFWRSQRLRKLARFQQELTA
ncbi:MAG: sigma-70 family RNA polymerase sigma factor, partial [Verrucomicrobiota bacterium]